jgi:hypothetical protein
MQGFRKSPDFFDSAQLFVLRALVMVTAPSVLTCKVLRLVPYGTHTGETDIPFILPQQYYMLTFKVALYQNKILNATCTRSATFTFHMTYEVHVI